jgi:hypothetical protein
MTLHIVKRNKKFSLFPSRQLLYLTDSDESVISSSAVTIADTQTLEQLTGHVTSIFHIYIFSPFFS